MLSRTQQSSCEGLNEERFKQTKMPRNYLGTSMMPLYKSVDDWIPQIPL